MKSEANKITEYLESMPLERREALEEVRKVVLQNIPDGYVETFQYGMISYVVPFDKFSSTYNNQPLALLSIGNQKSHMALYMNNIYSDEEIREWFTVAYNSTGKRLDMGKSCVRFKKLENLPLEVIGEAVAKTSVEEFIKMYENAKMSSRRKKR